MKIPKTKFSRPYHKYLNGGIGSTKPMSIICWVWISLTISSNLNIRHIYNNYRHTFVLKPTFSFHTGGQWFQKLLTSTYPFIQSFVILYIDTPNDRDLLFLFLLCFLKHTLTSPAPDLNIILRPSYRQGREPPLCHSFDTTETCFWKGLVIKEVPSRFQIYFVCLSEQWIQIPKKRGFYHVMSIK